MSPDPYRPAQLCLPWAVNVADLPPAEGFPGRMIWTKDLYQDFAEPHVALAGWLESDGASWIPRRGLAVAAIAAAGSTLTWRPLTHRPVLVIEGALETGTMAIEPSANRAWNGCQLLVIRRATGNGIVTVLDRDVAPGGALQAVFDGASFQPVTIATAL